MSHAGRHEAEAAKRKRLARELLAELRQPLAKLAPKPDAEHGRPVQR